MRTMKDMKKVLTVVMALAVAFAGVVVLFGEDSAADASSPIVSKDRDEEGGLYFDFESVHNGISNYDLKNQIEVTSQKEGSDVIYTVTGILAKQSLNVPVFDDWEGNPGFYYGIAFNVDGDINDPVEIGDNTDAKLDGTNCLLYVKEPGQKKVVYKDNTYVIDFTGVTLADEENSPDVGYVIIPNTNAFDSNGGDAKTGVDGHGGKWSLNGGILELTNYNGKELFCGDFTEVILVGKNTLTLSGTETALFSESGITIKSVDGVGSLAIVMETESNSCAIFSEGVIEINGVDVSISITEKYNGSPDAEDCYKTFAVIGNEFEIFDALLTINVAQTNYYSAFGIFSSSGLEVKSSEVNVIAGCGGIVAANIEVAASVVNVAADLVGIEAISTNGSSEVFGKILVTNQSKVDVEVFGLGDDNYPYYGVAAGDMSVQSDSELQTFGLLMNGNAVNNATLINDGEFVVAQSAVFENAAEFINNGIIGVYGSFINSEGKTTNAGSISNYTKWIGSTDVSLISGYDEKSLTISFDASTMSPLAGGKFQVRVTVSDSSGEGTVYEGTVYEGTVEYLLGGGYIINALSSDERNILSVIYNPASSAEKYNIYSTEFEYSMISEKEADSSNPVSSDTVKGATTENKATIKITGGKMVNNGKIVLNSKSPFVTDGEMVNNGSLYVNADIVVEGKMSGNDAVVSAGVTMDLSGEINMIFSHSGSYSSMSSATTTSVTQFTNVVQVVGKVDGVIIGTPKANDSTRKGMLNISGDSQIEAKGKETAVITVLQGSASVAGAVGTGMEVKVVSGATLDIDKVCGAEAIAGVISVQDGAKLNMKVLSDRNTYSYGELTYTISFQNEGYTYYGSIQFALANAAEGTTLKLESNATIDADTAVKKGITLVFADGAGLAIDGPDNKKIVVSMGEGAKFVLGASSELTVGQNVTFSGTVVYDINEIVLDKVKVDGSAEISGVKASATNSSSLAVDVKAIDGTINISKGLSTGELDIYYALSSTDKLDTTSKLVISLGATFKSSTTDNSFVDSKYADTVVDGTLSLNAGTVIKGKISGVGFVILKDAISVKFEKTATIALTLTNGTDEFIFDGVTGAVHKTDGTIDDTKSKEFTVSSVAKTATKAAYLVIYGNIVKGTVTSEGNAVLGTNDNGFEVGPKAIFVVPVNSTLTIAKVTEADQKVSANGLLKVAGKLNMKIEGDSTTDGFGALVYDITYVDGEYTVYTVLSTGVSNASAGDSFEVTDDLTIEESMQIPAGVTLIIADGKSITVPQDKYITIGTPMRTVGAISSIQGKIILANNAFVIVYADDSVDMSEARIVTISGTSEITAKNSQYSVLNEVYATVYVGPETTDGNVDAVLSPEIDGCRFLGWTPLVEGDSTVNVGKTDFEANMKASMVKVTFTKVDGISYYVDNEKQNLVGAPVYVAYGSTVTAVADYGYTGNALVNGQAYIIVDTDTTTITGSGVSVSEPEVTVDPAKDDSMGITEYLLIVLVVLAAILVVVVAIRMMRS